MKKITLFSLLLMFSLGLSAQNINNTAVWGGGTSWTVTGSSAGEVDPAIFEANPTAVTNFAWNDDAAGNGVVNDVAAESPIIDLTPAGAETWIRVTVDYNYNWITAATLFLEYWDADLGAWVVWHSYDVDTSTAPTVNFCASPRDNFVSNQLDISGWTPTQLSGFRYRFNFDDAALGDNWAWGMCLDQPTLTSELPPACADPTGLTISNIFDVTADFSWTENGTAVMWDIELVDITGGGTPGVNTGVPTTNDHGSTTFGFTGLAPSNDYEAWVRADCGGLQSAWSGPIAFTTNSGPPPANDLCANATAIGCAGVIAFDTTNATQEDATTCTTTATSPEVWFTYTEGGVAQDLTFSTCDDASFDTKIHVFSGSCGALTCVIGNDDGAGCGGFTSLTPVFTSTPGTTYFIKVSGFGDVTGTGNLTMTCTTLGLGEFEQGRFEYFPNPVNDNLTLRAQSNIEAVSVYNMLGQEVKRMLPNNVSSEVDMTELSQGAYFVKVTINGATETIRIIKK